jgi:LmbE family N-acetylglucosaminyl deacetylase
MVIHAHPDDQDFTVSGTLAKWARAGCYIVGVCITSGDAGSNEPGKDRAYKIELARIREREQIDANAVIGIKETIFLHYPDGELEPTLALRKELTRLIRIHKPEVVVTGDPSVYYYGSGYMNHPDHRAAAQAACDAVFPSAGTRLIFVDLLEEGCEPHNVKRLYLHGSEKPDTWIDTTDTIAIKIEALKQHVSQVGGWDDLEKGMREWAAEDGKEKGLAYAESFKVMILVDDRPQDEGK